MGAYRVGSVLAVGVAALVGMTVIVTTEGWLHAQSSPGLPQFFVPVDADGNVYVAEGPGSRPAAGGD